jgi:hypothetical protein
MTNLLNATSSRLGASKIVAMGLRPSTDRASGRKSYPGRTAAPEPASKWTVCTAFVVVVQTDSLLEDPGDNLLAVEPFVI